MHELHGNNSSYKDISQDILPKLLGRAMNYLIEGIHVDIGTDLETYLNIQYILVLRLFYLQSYLIYVENFVILAFLVTLSSQREFMLSLMKGLHGSLLQIHVS